ncbi:MAG: protein kinase [Acidobacteria bacterium]|nr:protein kinase [Acidobacteriota bacterium]
MTPERWQRVEELFQTVIEQPNAAREAYLTRACGGDEELRREVLSLLAHEVADTFLQDPIKTAAASLSAEPRDELIGQRIGAYRVTSLLGRGGMGEVYAAVRADQQFEQQVAIKIIRRGMDSEFIRERFLRERQILAQLEHPFIARLLDGGTTPDGLPYFVMEFVAGEPITSYCQQRQLGVREKLHLFRQVCAAVQHAHQKLVVHRDLKPGNILVTSDGTPKLLDFGIAKLLSPEAGQARDTRTDTALRLMTPDYASPEQARGLPVTTATDVYSLGVVLYELLTDCRPHQFKTFAPAEIERAICETLPLSPSNVVQQTGRQTKLARQLHGDLDNIILMALRKEPERRYTSVEQLSEDVQRYLTGMPVVARADTFAYRASKFVGRHAWAVAAAALVLLSLLGGIVATTRAARIAQAERLRAEANLAEARAQKNEAEAQRTEAERQRAEAERQRSLANEQRLVAEAQAAEATRQRSVAETERARADRRFAQVRQLANKFLFDFHDQIRELPGATAARASLVSTALEYLDSLAQESDGDPALQWELAMAYARIGDVQGAPNQANLGQAKAALESYRKALHIEQTLIARAPNDENVRRTLATTYYKSGSLRLRLGEPLAARSEIQQGLALIETPGNRASTDPELYRLKSQGHALLGDVADLLDADAEMLRHFRQNLASAERWAALQPNIRARQAVANGHYRLGRAQLGGGDLEAALASFGVSVSQYETLLRETPTDVSMRRSLGVIYAQWANVLGMPTELNVGRPVEAVAHFRKALAIYQELAAADAKNALARADIAWVRRELGICLREVNPTESVAMLKDALAASSGGMGRGPNGLGADLYLELAKSQLRAGATQDALQNARKAEQSLQGASALDMAKVGIYLHYFHISLGNLLLSLGDASGALTHLQMALPLAQAALAEKPANLALQRDLADCYEGLGSYYVGSASAAQLTSAQQAEHWRQARHWYQKSQRVWQTWTGAKSVFTQRRTALVAQALARCDQALATLTSARRG